jgi:hypothetical protein
MVMDNASKRDEIYFKFTLDIDGVSRIRRPAEYVSDNTVFWKASVGCYRPAHEVILARYYHARFSKAADRFCRASAAGVN